VINCGLFHTFSDEERPLYVACLSKVVRPGCCVHVHCFSDQEPPGQGPRRVTQQEIRKAFRDGWLARLHHARYKGSSGRPLATERL
jgi:cyclopropane fatty-acyl-phospholipid synthase-like methyltransferase